MFFLSGKEGNFRLLSFLCDTLQLSRSSLSSSSVLQENQTRNFETRLYEKTEETRPNSSSSIGSTTFLCLSSPSFWILFLHVRHAQKFSRHTSSETLELLFFFFFISCSEEVFLLLFCFPGIEVSFHATVVACGKRAPIPVWIANENLDLGTRCSCCPTQLCEEQDWKSSLMLESMYLSSSAVVSISSQKRRWEGRREAREGRRVG